MDGITPECRTEAGCPIPALEQEGRRTLEIRSMILRLKGLIDPGTICRICSVELSDLELLAIIEEQLNAPGADHD